MRKVTLRKLLALALIGTMAMGTLAGCGKKETSETTTEKTETTETKKDTTTTEKAETTAPTAEPAAVAGIDGWTAFENNVTLKIPVYDRGVEGVPSVSENYWTKWIQENFGNKYNVTVEFVPITRSDVMTDYALLAAAEDLPTVLMEYDYPKVAQWANDGYLTTFNMDDFAQVAPTYYNRMVENNQLSYSVMNDETYFALALRPYYNEGYTFQTFVRMDWLKAVGYDHVPANRAEQVDAFNKMKEAGLTKYPLGGSMVTGVGSDQNYSYRNYPLNEEEWAMYSSVSIPSIGWEADYKCLQRANDDFNLGFTNPEYYITDEETNKAAFVNGEIYQFGGYISANMDWLNAFYENNPNAELAIAPIAAEDDTAAGTNRAYRADNPFGMIVGFSSKATEDELKAAWMYMEWMTQEENLFTMQWGIEGENYTVDATTGLPVAVGDYQGEFKQGYNNSKDYWCITIEARNAGTIEQIIAAAAPQGLPQDFTQDIIDFYYDRKELAAAGYYCNDPIFSVAIDAEAEYSGTLIEKYKEFRDELTMCAPEKFDELYKKYAAEYADAGFKEITEQRLAAFKDGKSTKLAK